MDSSNLRPTHGAATMESGDWRAQLQADSRQKVVDKIMSTCTRHFSFSGDKGLQELKDIAVRFEEKIYTSATSQSDYSRKIAMKMLTMETRSQNSNSTANSLNPTDPGRSLIQFLELTQNPIDSNSTASSLNPSYTAFRDAAKESGDWRAQLQADSRERIVNKITNSLRRHHQSSGLQELKEMAVRLEEEIYTSATSQSDYLRKISLKMLTMEARSQSSMESNSTANS